MHLRRSVLREEFHAFLLFFTTESFRTDPKNYHRALIWTAVMTFFSHVDPDFESVFAIEAVNEPLMDANLTPGYGQCTSTSS